MTQMLPFCDPPVCWVSSRSLRHVPIAEPTGTGPGPDRHATGQAVLAAAATLLAERGPGGFSVRAVATQAGHSTISIYHHFGRNPG
jgi:Bacterial regulatory proteins, tetR family